MSEEEISAARARLAELAAQMEKDVGGKPYMRITLSKEGPVIESFAIPVEAIPIIMLMVAQAVATGSTTVEKISSPSPEKVN